MATLSERKAKAITKVVLDAALAPEILVTVRDRVSGNLRFARNQPTTEGDVEALEISVTASVKGQTATAVGNRSDKDSLRALVAEAEELAALSPIDPEHMPPMGSAPMLQVDGHDKATAKLGAKERAEWAEKVFAVAADEQVEAAGFIHHAEESFALATSAGAFAHYPSTEARVTVTCRTRDETGSGWAGSESYRGDWVDSRTVAHFAAEKGYMSATPKAMDPGNYLVILEAPAVASLLSFLVGALDARKADEGRSWFSHPDGGTRIGEELFHTSIKLRSNPADHLHPARPFADDGQAHKVVEWIGDGVLKNLSRTRYWADKTGAEPLPEPNSVFLDGQDIDLTDLVGAVDRAVLVTRFWYNRMLDPRTILATGLTRDGTFLVEQGKITTSVNNFRYNDSPVTLLRNVLAVGRPERVVMRGGRVMVVPPMVVRDFNFSSTSAAV